VTLRAGGYEAVFLPELGMLGASLKLRGSELLSLHGGAAAFRAGHTTGLPLLAPWANRLSRRRFRVAGVDVDLRRVPLHLDANRLPIHGTMVGPIPWEVVHLAADRLVARYEYEDRAFPFPHELRIDARVSASGLRVATSLRPTGQRRVPVSFGWHPYFRASASSILRMPACRHLELDRRAIPTGRSAPARAESVRLRDRSFDDLFALGRNRTFVLHRNNLDLHVRFGAGYAYAQIYAPPGKPFAAIEPMTAPIDGLVTGNCPIVKPGERFSAVFTVSASSTPRSGVKRLRPAAD
jgi:galactose mutarotase-like enzyme